MSSLTPKENIIFIVQSGIVAWEDPEVVIDWRRTTVTICAAKLLSLSSVLLEIVSSSLASLSFFRFHTDLLAPNTGRAQRHKLLSSLRKDSPGFNENFAVIVGSRVCSVSKLTQSSSLDLNYLSAYRNTSLLEADDATFKSSENLCNALCGTFPDFGGASIAQVLIRPGIMTVLRVLEQESHSALQIMCSAEASAHVVGILAKRGIPQIHDVRTVSTEIARLA